MLGWQDVRQSYRRTALGPFWLTIGVVAQVLTISVVFGIIFKSPIQDYLPFIATGMVTWGFISSMINEGTYTFINAEAIIKQLPLPMWVHVFRVSWRNLIIMAHNFVIVPLAYLIVGKAPSFNLFFFAPGLLLILLNLTWMASIAGLVSARFRDFPAIVLSVMTVVFYVTPVMWEPKNFEPGIAHLLLGLNPFYHLIQLGRLPLLGGIPTIENWVVGISLAFFGTFAMKVLNRRFGRRIALWV